MNMDKAKLLVTDHPFITAGVAFVLGLLLG